MPSPLINKNKKNTSGQVIVEFTLVTSFFLILILAAIEFTSIFIEKQKVGALSREAASICFRECYNSTNRLDNDAKQATDAGACLDANMDSPIDPKVYQGAQRILRNFGANGAIIVTYLLNTTTPLDNGWNIQVVRMYPAGGNGYRSRLWKLLGGAGETFHNYTHVREDNTYHCVVCVGEVWYHHVPLTPIGSLLGIILPGDLYEITAY